MVFATAEPAVPSQLPHYPIMNAIYPASKAWSAGAIGKATLPKSGGITTAKYQQKGRSTPSSNDLPGQSFIVGRYPPPKYLCLSTMARIKFCKDWRDAIEAIQDVERQGYVPDKHMFCAAITKCGKQGMWVECLKMLNLMTTRYGEKGDAAVFNAALSGVAKAGKKYQALQLLHEIKESGISPSVKTFTIAVSACGSDWKMALSLIEEMKKQRIEPDCFSYCAVIASCGKGGQAGTAMELFDEMRKQGIEPNNVLYCSLINACFENKKFAEALRVVREATAKGVYPKFDESCGEWDLCQPQGLSEATSCMLIADALISTAMSFALFPFGNFGDITMSLGTKKSGVLRRKVPSFLTEMGLKLTSPVDNSGRIVLLCENIQDWVCSLEYKVWKSVLLYGTSDLWRCVL